MTFLEHIVARIERDADAVVLREIRDGKFVSVTGAELLALVFQARRFISTLGTRRTRRHDEGFNVFGDCLFG